MPDIDGYMHLDNHMVNMKESQVQVNIFAHLITTLIISLNIKSLWHSQKSEMFKNIHKVT